MCHDRTDKLEGRPKRNWSEEQFLCASCTAKAQNKRPRRGRKPKDAVVTDPEDVIMNPPETPAGNEVAMDISQPASATLTHDSAQPSIELAQVEQPAPSFSDQEPGQVPGPLEASHPLPPAEQYSETLTQAQRLVASTRDTPPRETEQHVAPNPPVIEQYSAELAMAQKAVASHSLGNPPPEPAQYVQQSPQFSGYPQVYPIQWNSTTHAMPYNGAMMNGTAYSTPPVQVAPHGHPPPILNGDGQGYRPPLNLPSVYPQPTAPS